MRLAMSILVTALAFSRVYVRASERMAVQCS